MAVWIRPKHLPYIEDMIKKSKTSVQISNDDEGGLFITNCRSNNTIYIDYNGKIKKEK